MDYTGIDDLNNIISDYVVGNKKYNNVIKQLKDRCDEPDYELEIYNDGDNEFYLTSYKYEKFIYETFVYTNTNETFVKSIRFVDEPIDFENY